MSSVGAGPRPCGVLTTGRASAPRSAGRRGRDRSRSHGRRPQSGHQVRRTSASARRAGVVHAAFRSRARSRLPSPHQYCRRHRAPLSTGLASRRTVCEVFLGWGAAKLSKPVVFVSDLGLRDEFVGVCHAVIARISPGSTVIDISHGVAPHDVRAGGLILAESLRFAPADAVGLAVGDPGVRSWIGWRSLSKPKRGASWWGPDNGVLSLAWRADGGARRAVAISAPDVVLEPISNVFHGRDVFAPAAAHLASGADLSVLGPRLSCPTSPRSAWPSPRLNAAASRGGPGHRPLWQRPAQRAPVASRRGRAGGSVRAPRRHRRRRNRCSADQDIRRSRAWCVRGPRRCLELDGGHPVRGERRRRAGRPTRRRRLADGRLTHDRCGASHPAGPGAATPASARQGRPKNQISR